MQWFIFIDHESFFINIGNVVLDIVWIQCQRMIGLRINENADDNYNGSRNKRENETFILTILELTEELKYIWNSISLWQK